MSEAWSALEAIDPELLRDDLSVDWRRRRDLLQRGARRLGDEGGWLQLEMGVIEAQALDDLPGAVERWRAASAEGDAAPSDGALRRALLWALCHQEDEAAVAEEIDDLMMAEGPEIASLLIEQGVRLQEAGEIEASVEPLREALSRAPEDELCWWRLAAATPLDDRRSWQALIGHRLQQGVEPPVAARLHMAAAALYAVEPRGIPAAIRHVEQAWTLDPAVPLPEGAIRALLRASTAPAQQGELDLGARLAQAAEGASTPEARAMLGLLIARLTPEGPDNALLSEARHALKGTPWAISLLATQQEAAGDWAGAARALEDLAATMEGPARALILYRAGVNAELAGGSGARLYEQATEADPRCLAAWAALRRQAARRDDFEATVLCDEAMANLDVPEALSRAWRLVAHLSTAARLGVPGAEVLAPAVALDGELINADEDTQLAAWAALSVLMSDGMSPKALSALRRWADAEEDGAAGEIGLTARRTLAEHLQWAEGDLPQATMWWRQILAERPGDSEATRILMQISEAAGDEEAWLEWATAWGATLSEATPRQAARLAQVGHRARQGGHLHKAESLWRQALTLDPASLSARVGLGRLLNRLGRWRDLAHFHEEELSSLPDGDPRALALLAQLANLYAHQLDEESLAASTFEALLEAAPERLDAQLGLERIYSRQQRVEALRRVLEIRATHTDDLMEQAVVWLSIADLAWTHELPLEGLWPRLQALTAHLGEMPTGVDTLARVALGADEAEEAAPLIRALAGEGAPSPEIAHLAARLGVITWASVVDLWPDDQDARWAELIHDRRGRVADALSALSAAVESDEDRAAVRTVAAALSDDQPLVDRARRWREILALRPADEQAWAALASAAIRGVIPDELSQLARHVEGADVRGAIFWVAALWSQARGDKGLAERHLSTAHRLNPTDPVPPWLLLRTQDPEGTPPGIRAALLEQMAHAFEEPELAAEALTEAGRLWAGGAGDVERGLAAYRRALQRCPKSKAAFDGALALLDEGADPRARAELLKGRALQLDDRQRRREMLLEVARVYLEGLDDPAEARAVLKILLEYEPQDTQAWRRVANLSRAAGDVAEARRCLTRLIELTKEREQLAMLHREMGHLLYTEAREPWAAIEQFERSLELQSGDRETLLALAAIREQSGDPLGALSAWERLAVMDPVGTQSEIHQARNRLTHALVEQPLDAAPAARPLDIDYSPASEAVSEAMSALGVPRIPTPLPEARRDEPSLSTQITQAPEMRSLMRAAGLEALELDGADLEDAALDEAGMMDTLLEAERLPLDTDGWQALAETCRRSGDEHGARWAEALAAWLDGAPAPLPRGQHARVLPEVLRERALPDDIPRPLCRALRLLAPETAKAYGEVMGSGLPVDEGVWAEALAGWALTLRPPTVQGAVITADSPQLCSADLQWIGAEPTTLAVDAEVLDGATPEGLSTLAVAALLPVVEGLRPIMSLDDNAFGRWLRWALDEIEAPSGQPIGLPGMNPYTLDVEALPRQDELAQVAHSCQRLIAGRDLSSLRQGLLDYHRRLCLALTDDVAWAMGWLIGDPDRIGEEECERRQQDLLCFAATPHCLAIRRWLQTG